MCTTVCNPLPKVYVGGPAFNGAEKTEQCAIAKWLESNCFCTYLPQRDGLDINKVIEELIAEGRSPAQAQAEAQTIIFQFNVYNLMKSQVFLANINGVEPDPGTISLAGIAFASSMPVVLFKDDTRVLTTTSEISPMILGLTIAPVVRRRRDIPCAIDKILPKRDAKSISDTIRAVVKAGGEIIPGRFRCKK